MRINYHLFVLFAVLGIMTSCILTEPNKPSIIVGVVTNSAGIGLADVTVQLDSTTENTSVMTDADGKYQFDLPAGGVCKLLFGKIGYTVQSQIIAVRSGETKTLNAVLKTLAEEAYFRINLTEPNLSFPNVGGNFSLSIATNSMYDFQCSADWISCIKTSNNFSFTVSGNETFAERNATIKLKSEYGKSYTLNIKQSAGPYLALLDYIGKDFKTNFLTTEPFITFNRPVTLKSCVSSEVTVDLTVRYSADRKTVYFPNLKITPLSFVTVNYTVQSDENFMVSSGFDLRLYVNFQYVSDYLNMVFTKDNQYLWVLTNTELIQFNVNNMAMIKKVALPSNFGSTQMVYNPYNNSLYINQYSYADGRNFEDVRIYNAATGNLTTELKLDDGNKKLNSLAFNSNGYGIMVFGGKLYFFDSANNHTYGLFSQQSIIYDPADATKLLVSSINTCNDFKTLVLDGASTAGSKYVFTVDADTKTISKVYSGTENQLRTSNFSTGFFLFNTNENKLTYFDLNTNKSTALATKTPIKFLSPLVSDSEIPNALTNDLSFLSLKNGTINKYALNVENGIVAIKSTNDGKLVAIYYGSKIYIINKDLFGLYSSKLKQ